MNDMSCPWSGYVRDPFPFCEEQICHIIGQPANVWSNIGYLIAALLLMRSHRDSANPLQHRDRLLFGALTLFLFFGSTLFHMSGTLWAKRLDLYGMIMISAFILSLSAAREFRLSNRSRDFIFGILFFTSIPFVGYGRFGGYIFIAQALLATVFELIRLKRKHLTSQQTKWISAALFAFGFGLVINTLDQRQILCWPDNHIMTGHGAWHLLTAFSIYMVAKFYTEPA